MAIDYSFIGRGVQPLNLQEQPEGVDPQQALVDRLIASLEPSPVPPPPQLPPAPTGGRQILGNIGDALRAMASVRTGAQPPLYGPFAASEMKRQEETMALQREYAKETAAARSADRNERNRIRAEAGIVGLRGMANAQPKQRAFQFKQIQTKDERGLPVTIGVGYDPNRNTLVPIPGQEKPFERYVRPMLVPGVNEDTGQAEYRMVEPTMGGAAGLRGLQPMPTGGEVTQATTGLALGETLKRAEDSFNAYVQSHGTAGRIGTSALLKLPFGIGAAADEFVVSYTDPEGSLTARDLSNVADILLRLRSGAQINEAEYARLRALLPRLGENPVSAAQKFKSFRSELTQRLNVNMRLRPALFSDEALNKAGFTRRDILSLTEAAGTEGGGNLLEELWSGGGQP